MDALLIAVDSALRTLFSRQKASRFCNAEPEEATETKLSDSERIQSGALMRVNHVGEICAQALYTAQALAARQRQDPDWEALATRLETAGKEETDHLAWTRDRLDELGERPSLLNPFWYGGAFCIGFVAGHMGKGTSLGFVVETERQVEAHLASHLERLPINDHASRTIVAQMKADEARHAYEAQRGGASELSEPIKTMMKAAARVMTTIAHRI